MYLDLYHFVSMFTLWHNGAPTKALSCVVFVMPRHRGDARVLKQRAQDDIVSILKTFYSHWAVVQSFGAWETMGNGQEKKSLKIEIGLECWNMLNDVG